MNIKEQIQKANDRLDKIKSKLVAAEQRKDFAAVERFKKDIEKATKKKEHLKGQQTKQLGGKGREIEALPFNRPITKAEQADMGKLKKSVRGLVVVHPMTALGREIGVKVVTGFASAKF